MLVGARPRGALRQPYWPGFVSTLTWLVKMYMYSMSVVALCILSRFPSWARDGCK